MRAMVRVRGGGSAEGSGRWGGLTVVRRRLGAGRRAVSSAGTANRVARVWGRRSVDERVDVLRVLGLVEGALRWMAGNDAQQITRPADGVGTELLDETLVRRFIERLKLGAGAVAAVGAEPTRGRSGPAWCVVGATSRPAVDTIWWRWEGGRPLLSSRRSTGCWWSPTSRAGLGRSGSPSAPTRPRHRTTSSRCPGPGPGNTDPAPPYSFFGRGFRFRPRRQPRKGRGLAQRVGP